MEIIIKEINYGIASRIGSTVYLHKGLKEFPELRNALIQHELEHSSGYTFKDIADDFGVKELKGRKKSYYKFIFKNPLALVEYLPICKYNGKWVLSPSIALFWIFTIIIFWFTINNIR